MRNIKITDQQIEKLIALSRDATPGPWQRNGSHVYGPDPQRRLIGQLHYEGVSLEDKANECLIITGRNLAPLLARELQFRTAERDGAQATLEASREGNRKLYAEFELVKAQLATAQAEAAALRQALESIHLASRGVPDQLGSNFQGDCSFQGCECLNHLARKALATDAGKSLLDELAALQHTRADKARIDRIERYAEDVAWREKSWCAIDGIPKLVSLPVDHKGKPFPTFATAREAMDADN